MKLNARQLRKKSAKCKVQSVKLKKNEIYIVLDNVLDTYNIGSIFRLADAVAAKKVYLCGGTETPPNPRIKKASINTTEWVEWEWCETAVEAVTKVRNLWGCHPEGAKRPKDLSTSLSPAYARDSSLIARNDKRGMIIVIEQSPKSVPYNTFEYKLPIVLVVGNETTGVSKGVLEMADAVVEIPMFGVNISLNVMVSLAIVLYKMIENVYPERSGEDGESKGDGKLGYCTI